MPLFGTPTVPVLLNVALMVEVSALPLLVKVPKLLNTEVAPVSPLPWELVRMVSPLAVVWSLNVAPLAIVRFPEPVSLNPVLGSAPFRLIWPLVPVAVLAPPNCNVRPPSSEKFVVLNKAPPCAIVVPDPLSRPPDNVDRPDIVNMPVPLRRPEDWVSATGSHRPVEGCGTTSDSH